MNLFRIVQKRTNKREHNGSPLQDVLTVLLFVFLLPYVISCLWGHVGEETDVLSHRADTEETERIDERYEVELVGDWGTKHMTMQEYLIRKLKVVMPKEEGRGKMYEPEALKAQAVLIRTELWGLFRSGEDTVVLQDEVLLYDHDEVYTQEEESLYAEAVMVTDGLYLSYEGKPIKASFFPVSSGQTRNADEALANGSYPYLISVECEQDILAKDYQSQVTYSKEEYGQRISELFGEDQAVQDLWNRLTFTYDSAGYVIKAEADGAFCSGETFRYAFGLSSASFRAEWGEDAVTFYVKGAGHGFGMSQYGANEKAAAGDTFNQILEHYFFQVELVKIE